jgi:uncharacterized protein (TIGR00369 family)
MPAPIEIMRTFMEGRRRFPLAEVLDMTLDELTPGRAVFSFQVGPTHLNPMGTVHGGLIATLADSAMVSAHMASLDDGEASTTVEFKVNFLRPVFAGRVTAIGTVESAGQTLTLSEARVLDEQGRLVARATATCMTLRGVQAQGRTVEAQSA